MIIYLDESLTIGTVTNEYLELEAAMYNPMYDMVTERQSHILQVADNSRKLAGLKAAKPGLRRRLIYTIGGMLIAFGTRLRGSAPEPAPSASYGMTEGC